VNKIKIEFISNSFVLNVPYVEKTGEIMQLLLK